MVTTNRASPGTTTTGPRSLGRNDSVTTTRSRKVPFAPAVAPSPAVQHLSRRPLTRGRGARTLTFSSRPRVLGKSSSGLSRHDTLLTTNATPTRAAAELKSILGNRQARLKPKVAPVQVASESAALEHVTLEQAKPRARVQVDILPQNNVCVQGGYFRGHIKIHVRERTQKEDPVAIAGGKIRVIGFETQGDTSRSIFYQCSAMLSSVTPSLEGLYVSEADQDGFATAREGEHDLPFALYLSLSTEHGQAKGPFRAKSGVSLNYIAMMYELGLYFNPLMFELSSSYSSLKIKDGFGRRSVAHFYRSCEIWPRLDPTTVLSSALRPLQATVSTDPSRNSGDGRIGLTASLHRLHWVAGQYCKVKVLVDNDTNRTLKGLTLSLHRSLTSFQYSPDGDLEPRHADVDRHAPVSVKQVAESTLRMGQSGIKGYASAAGWWTGVRPAQVSEFEHSILIPMDALTISRGRLFEVEYTLRVSMDSGSRLVSDVQVVLPIRIIGFLSIDSPPSNPVKLQPLMTRSPRPGLACSQQGSKTTITSSSVRPNSSQLCHIQNSDIQYCSSVNAGVEHTATNNLRDGSADKLVDAPYGDKLCSNTRSELQCSDPEEAELGNLSLIEDTDDVVQHAVTTAWADLAYAGFSDLFYASQDQDPDETPDRSETDSYEHSSDNSECMYEISASRILKNSANREKMRDGPGSGSGTYPGPKFQKRSTFSARVEEKTRLATVTYLNGGQPEHQATHSQEAIERTKQGRPRLSLKISPVLGRQRCDDFQNAEQARTHSSMVSKTSEKCRPSETSPTQRANKDQWRLSSKSQTWAASMPKSESLNSSLSSVRTRSTPLFLEPYQEPMLPGPSNLCCHCRTRYAQVYATIAGSSTLTTGLQQQKCPSEEQSNDDTSLYPSQPRGMGVMQALIDSRALYGNFPCTSTPNSAVSTASHVTDASIGNVSVKDKVRELEERVKAAALT